MTTLNQVVFGPPALPFRLLEDMIEAAITALQEAGPRVGPQLPRSRRGGHALGCTLRPGAETPLWNDLVRQIRPHLRRRGSKAQLARLLGVPRQRLQMVVKTGSACLDAERTLMLVGWLGFFQRGGELAPVVRAGRPARKRGPDVKPAAKSARGNLSSIR